MTFTNDRIKELMDRDDIFNLKIKINCLIPKEYRKEIIDCKVNNKQFDISKLKNHITHIVNLEMENNADKHIKDSMGAVFTKLYAESLVDSIYDKIDKCGGYMSKEEIEEEMLYADQILETAYGKL